MESVSLNPPAAAGALAPRLYSGAAGVTLSWLEPGTLGEHRFRLALLTDLGWQSVQTIAEGDDFFANWADTPATIHTASGLRLASWLAKLGDTTYAYGAFVAAARGNSPWQVRGLLHDDTSPTEHGFVSWLDQHPPRAFWLDGRAMLSAESDEEGKQAGDAVKPPGTMQLRTTTLDAEGRPTASEMLDDRVCECCPTDAAPLGEGAIVVYRDRSQNEVRDISMVRLENGTWSQPQLVHEDGWRIFGCPVNGPAVDTSDRTVAVAWFTAAKEQPRVQLAWSRDGGKAFSPPWILDAANPVGRVDLTLRPRRDGMEACVTWIGHFTAEATPKQDDEKEAAAAIRLLCIDPEGHTSLNGIVAPSSRQRTAGVPRLALAGRRLLIAWVAPEASADPESDASNLGISKLHLAAIEHD